MTVVRPKTLVAWHRKGFRLFWRWKSRSGRRPIPFALRCLIRRMARDNPPWGEERIANELLLKLGLRVSPRTVRKYLPKLPAGPPGRPRADQRWSTFLGNHARFIVACDFFVAVTCPWSKPRLLWKSWSFAGTSLSSPRTLTMFDSDAGRSTAARPLAHRGSVDRVEARV